MPVTFLARRYVDRFRIVLIDGAGIQGGHIVTLARCGFGHGVGRSGKEQRIVHNRIAATAKGNFRSRRTRGNVIAACFEARYPITAIAVGFRTRAFDIDQFSNTIFISLFRDHYVCLNGIAIFIQILPETAAAGVS